MKIEVFHGAHSENGISLYLVPETPIERSILSAFWRHGKLERTNGIADRSPEGFAISWKPIESEAKP